MSETSVTDEPRQLIVVETETTGLHDDAAILEVVAINVATGEELYFVPVLRRDDLGRAQGKAMMINRYFERGLFEVMLDDKQTAEHYQRLAAMLRGNTFGGCNPAFDAGLIKRQLTNTPWEFPRIPIGESWHHRLADLAAYAGPALCRAPHELLGLADICERLGVRNEDPHTALGDARATAECFRILTQHYADTMGPAKC